MYSPKTSLKELIVVSTLLFSSCTSPRVSGNYSFNRVKPIFQVECDESMSLDNVITELERVPDRFQKIGNEFGTVIFIEDRIVDQKEWKQYADKKHKTAGAWNKIPGAYNSQSRCAFVNIFARLSSVDNIVLHEYGHLIDHALGHIAYSVKFRQIFYSYEGSWFLSDHIKSSSAEFFAYCFANYFYSDSSRDLLKENFKTAHNFLNDLEFRVKYGEFE